MAKANPQEDHMNYHYTHNETGTPIGPRGRVARFIRAIIAGLDALHRAQFETPWREGPTRR
jgi:hypothetical protein